MKQPHILCSENDIAENVLLPGDPARVLRVVEFLDEWKEIAYNREFRTVTGKYKGMPLSIVSTGIGGPSAVIAMEELIACGAVNFIRIGSAGASQKNICIGDMILPTAVVREDGTSKMYINENYPAVADYSIYHALVMSCKKNDFIFHSGITRSHDSFYIDDEIQKMEDANKNGILGSDMETAALFTVASLRGVRAASILNNVVLYKGELKNGISSYADESDLAASEGEKKSIRASLDAFMLLNNTKK